VAAFISAHAAGEPVVVTTSGSTALPRAIVRTTHSWVSSFAAVSRLAGIDERSRVWVPGPVSATMNLFALVHATMTGAAVVGRPEDATHAHLTPAALARCLDGEVPMAGRTAVVAGDRLPAGLHARALAAGVTTAHYYGAAELSFVGWGSHAQDLRPFPGAEVSVRAGGEIWVRSPFVCLGYEGPPGPLRRSRDGFATVGDQGELREGVLLVWGRPGAVTVGGSTVELAAVEAVLRDAAVGDLVAVGLPHGSLGSVVAAVLTRPTDLAAVRKLARSRLAAPSRPRVWLHVDALPLTPAGKVDRLALARLAAEGDARRLV
jgi:acyl-CoA synthetase (AMP-forming)/AMP-acid ligase II